ncbi:hypothetical protein P0G10_15375 [Eubacteriales bacterium DFI.9.88]|nr:hypothetical protein [Eubacteriales bacterium DFI.9.88]
MGDFPEPILMVCRDVLDGKLSSSAMIFCPELWASDVAAAGSALLCPKTRTENEEQSTTTANTVQVVRKNFNMMYLPFIILNTGLFAKTNDTIFYSSGKLKKREKRFCKLRIWAVSYVNGYY